MTEALELCTEKMLAHVEPESGIGWITFNNPERRNAVSLEMWQALGQASDAFAADARVRVVVLRGAGDRAFVSGADISEFEDQRSNDDARANYDRVAGKGRARLDALETPVIAMIQGHCIGGGLAVALGADLRIASRDSTFGIPAARLGLGYRYAGVERLCAIVGPTLAAEILFTARRIDADEAERAGLLNRVVPVAELESAVRDCAARIAENAPLTVRAAKAAVRESLRSAEARDLKRVEAMVVACFDSEDYREGRRAFMQKRKPRFVGR